MSKITDSLNEYFIEMVKDVQAKETLTSRLLIPLADRAESPMPATKSIADAFYVALGCKFQDSPMQSVLLTLMFVCMIGVLLANFILSIFN